MNEKDVNKLISLYGNNKAIADKLGISVQHFSRLRRGHVKLTQPMNSRIQSLIKEPLEIVISQETRTRIIEAVLEDAFQEGVRSVMTLKQLEENRMSERSE